MITSLPSDYMIFLTEKIDKDLSRVIKRTNCKNENDFIKKGHFRILKRKACFFSKKTVRTI